MKKKITFFFLVGLLVTGLIMVWAFWFRFRPVQFDNNHLWRYALVQNPGFPLDADFFENTTWTTPEEKKFLDLPADRSDKILLFQTDIRLRKTAQIARLVFSYDQRYAASLYINGTKCFEAGQRNISPNLLTREGVSPDVLPVEEFWRHHKRFIDGSVLRPLLQEGENSLVICVTNVGELAQFRPAEMQFIFLHEGVQVPTIHNREAIPFADSNLPILRLQTNGMEIPDEPKINALLSIVESANGRNSLSGPAEIHKVRIERRGYTSLAFPKASYGFSIDNPGASDKVPLPGLAAAKKWVLYGPYADKSLMRNALTYDLSRKMGRYAPRTRTVELVINDNYQGIYLLTERIQIGPEHFDIPALRTTPDGRLEGGYLLELDRHNWVSTWPPGNPDEGVRAYYAPYSPAKSRLAVSTQVIIIRQFTRFEERLFKSHKPSDFMDLESFADYFILSELSKNPDAYHLSTYVFNADINAIEPRFGMGPVWDFNFAYGLKNNPFDQSAEGFVYENADGVPFWWQKLRSDPEFNALLKDRWADLRSGALSDSNIHAAIDSLHAECAEAATRNFKKWPLLAQAPVWPNHFAGESYAEEVQFLKQWLDRRLQYLDKNLK